MSQTATQTKRQEAKKETTTPIFGLRTLKKELIWYYVGVFLGTGSAGWSMWMNIDNALVPVTADVKDASGKIITHAWGWQQYVDKYVLMALLLGGITTIGAFLITHYGLFLRLWKKPEGEKQGWRNWSWGRIFNRSMIIAALFIILGAEILGRGLVYFYNQTATNAETWFLAIASLLFFMIPALLSPSVEQIYEQDAQQSEEQEQNLKVKELNEWRRKQLIKEYKRKIKPAWYDRQAKKSNAFSNMSAEQLAKEIDAITPGARNVVVTKIEEIPTVRYEDIIEGQTKVLSQTASSVSQAVNQLPGAISEAIAKAIEEEMGKWQQPQPKTDQYSEPERDPEPEPPIPPRGGGQPKNDELSELVMAGANGYSTHDTDALSALPVRRADAPPLDLSMLIKAKPEPEPLPANITPLRDDVVPVVKGRRGRPSNEEKRRLAEAKVMHG